ncbi:MAG: TonB-dependent receptor [Bacteroidales bacterium]
MIWIKSRFNLLAILYSFFYIINPANAQDFLNDTLQLEEVVVTGTRTSRNPREVPGRISVVTAEIIEMSAAQQVNDILRFIPGINVNRSTGIYSQRPMVTMRGLSGDEQSRTLALLNGVPVNTSDEGGVNWNRINHYDIERIEVYKGPGSSLYGNNAMGGVINIITKKPSKPQAIDGGIAYGTFNTVRQDLNIRIRNDKGYYGSVSQYYLQSDGYNNIPVIDRTPFDIARSLEEISLSVKAGNDVHQWLRWELQYDVFRDQRGEGYQIYTPKGNYRNFNTNLFRGNLRGGDSKTQYDLNVFYQLENYYDINERMRGDNYSRYDVDSYREDRGILFNANRELSTNNTLTAGFEFKQGGIEGGDYYQTPRFIDETTEIFDTIFNAGTINNLAGYLQDEHALLDNKIRLILGLRFDRVTFDNGYYYSTDPWSTMPELKKNTWTELSPRAGVRFNFIEEVSGYLSYSHGFRASILDDLTRTGWMWVGPKYANPELGPESLDNFEIGVDIFPLNNLQLSASAYSAAGRDFLYYVATGDMMFGRDIYRRENVTGVTLRGAETDIAYALSGGLIIQAGYTYADSRINSFALRPDLENKFLKYVPKHAASATIMWRNDYTDITFHGFYKGEQFGDDLNTVKIDPYVTFDIRLSRQISENYIVSLAFQDIFDNQHMETINYLSPGRLITARVAVKL